MRIKKTSETRALAGTILNAQNSSTTDTYSCDYINKAFGGVILWNNTSPNSSFGSQNVTLNTSDYNYLEIVYILTNYDYPNYAYYNSTGRIFYEVNRKIRLFSSDYDGNKGNISCIRPATLSNKTTINFGVGERFWTIGTETNNTYCIPMYIIGYK